jgi:hypothetical protein
MHNGVVQRGRLTANQGDGRTVSVLSQPPWLGQGASPLGFNHAAGLSCDLQIIAHAAADGAGDIGGDVGEHAVNDDGARLARQRVMPRNRLGCSGLGTNTRWRHRLWTPFGTMA